LARRSALGGTVVRRNNRVAAVFLLIAASMAGVAAIGTLTVVFVALALLFTVAALVFALRGRFEAW
jgi:hypothetical protein